MELSRALQAPPDRPDQGPARPAGRAAPCASWDVRALINHMTGTTRWWAGLLTGAAGPADADYAAGDYAV
ncbi:MAG: maleylpyruvate isomerase N-terminal domain-containing protein [Streptosporangiaceae bacterium]